MQQQYTNNANTVEFNISVAMKVQYVNICFYAYF